MQSKKLELIQWLSTIEDTSVINKIIALREKESKDWWTKISDAEKASIQKGVEDAESGKLKPHSKAKKLYDKWL